MGNAIGALSKSAFRIESDQGMVTGAYPTTEATADAEEVLLKSSDLIPMRSEGVEERRGYQPIETLLGTPGIEGSDLTSIMADGPEELMGYYDGLDAIIACALGFELGNATDSPTAQNSQALTSTASGATSYKDAGNPFVSGDVGEFIKVTSGAAEGQVRRISAYVGVGEVTVTPAWDSIPANATTAVMAQEWLHTFELANHLHDELWTDEYSSYPTGGVGTASDKILRRGTLGFLKWSTTPWVFRSAMINSLTIRLAPATGLVITAEYLAFNLDRASATNGAASPDNWALDNASGLFVANETIVFSDVDYFRVDSFANGEMTSADNHGIDEFEITINNNLKGDDQSANTGSFREQPARNASREVTGRIRIPRYAADTFLDWHDADTILVGILSLSGSTIATSARNFKVFLPSFKLEAPSAPVSGPGIVPQSYAVRCVTPASAPPTGFPTQNLTAPRSELMIQMLNQNPFSMLRDQNKEY